MLWTVEVVGVAVVVKGICPCGGCVATRAEVLRARPTWEMWRMC